MKKILNWKKAIYSSSYKIYSNEMEVGRLHDQSLTQVSRGEMNGKKYVFRTKGLFKQYTQIIDGHTDHEIGEIRFNDWNTKADIQIGDRHIAWKYDNVWNTRWSMSDTLGLEMNYRGSSTGGQIESSTDDELLILIGLFVTNYYWQAAIIIMVAVLVPSLMMILR